MSYWPVPIAFAVVLLSAWIMSKWLGAPSTSGRFAALDGLRGYLAFGVFIQHGAVWYTLLRTGVWTTPPSRGYTNLGQASVVLFFMITGFLFWGKLLQGRSRPVNWPRLYLSRILRLVPLYAFAIALLVLTVVVVTRFTLHESTLALAIKTLRWGSFTIFGAPDLNGLENTYLINAGVIWTLRYEWLFYCALPLLSLLIGVVPPVRYIVLSALIVAWLGRKLPPAPIYLAAFVGGILAATLAHLDRIPKSVRTSAGSVIAVVALLAAMILFPSVYEVLPLTLLTLVFTIIVGGNTLFGILEWPASRFLGQLTYSIYLLHGTILFWVFRVVIGTESAANYSFARHWLVICACIPMVILICSATFRWIELPGMNSVSRFKAGVRPD